MIALCLVPGALLPGCKRGDADTQAPVPPAGDPGDTPATSDGDGRVEPPRVMGSLGLGRKAEPRSRPDSPPIEGREAGLAAVRTGNPEGALEALGPLLANKTDDLELRTAVARAYALVGEPLKGAKVLAAGPRSQRQTAAVTRRRAALLRKGGDWKGAEELLRKGLLRQPKDLPLQGELLDLLVATGRRDQSEAQALIDGLYEAFGRGDATTADDLLAVARATLATRTNSGFRDANDVLSDAEEMAPAADGSWLGDEITLAHGRIFVEKYAHADAVETFQLVLARDPWHADALVALAESSLAELNLARASRAATEALRVDPHHPGAHALLAQVALVEGRRAEAVERLETHVLPAHPGHGPARAVLAAAAIYDGEARAYAASRDATLMFDPSGASFYARLADLLSALHLYPEIETVLAEAQPKDPKNPYVMGSRGLNLLRLGKEAEGQELIARAWKKDRFNERTFNTRKLYDERIASAYTSWTADDLTLRLPKSGQEVALPLLTSAVMEARTALDKRYGIDPTPMRLEVFDAPEDFSIRTVGVPSFGALGVCFGRVITLVGPYRGQFNFRQVVWHELAHTYAIEISAGRVPRWFTEGLSEWETELANPAWSRESAELLRAARDQDRLRRLPDLELAFLRAESPAMMEVAYATATYAVRYLGQTYGIEKLKAMLRGYAEGRTTDELMRKHLGKDLATVDREFQAWFDGQLDAKVTGWIPAQVPEGARDEKMELLRSATELASQGKLDEAAREANRLVASGGDGHVTQLLLARILLEQGKTAAAVTHLEASQKFNVESIDPLKLRARIAREQGDTDEEKRMLEAVLSIDAQGFAPAGELLLLALATKDDARLEIATRRARAINAVHPVALSGAAVLAKGKLAQTLLEAATPPADLDPAKIPADVAATIALAARRKGDKGTAKRLGAAALNDPNLHPAVRKALGG